MPNQEAPRVIQTLGPNAQGFSFALEEFEGRVQLRALHRPDYGPIYADWLSASMRSRIAGGRNQLLARAVGMRKTNNLKILDCTAGLGRDGFTLATLGAHVVMAERNPQIFALLQDAKNRALSEPKAYAAALRTQLVNNDAAILMPTEQWDAIYLDPMYADHGKSALPQKEMQIFRDLVSVDANNITLLSNALKTQSTRVVIKRAVKAEWLEGIKPTLSLVSTQARFDVYIGSRSNDC